MLNHPLRPEPLRVAELDPANMKYVVRPATRAGESPDTLMYVFNFADSAGFALVARLSAVTNPMRRGRKHAVRQKYGFRRPEQLSDPPYEQKIYSTSVRSRSA